MLQDTTDKLYSRNVPTSHIKAIANEKVLEKDKHFEILSVLDHKGDNVPNYIYLFRWKNHNADHASCWTLSEDFDSTDAIKTYWKCKNIDRAHIREIIVAGKSKPDLSEKHAIKRKSTINATGIKAGICCIFSLMAAVRVFIDEDQ